MAKKDYYETLNLSKNASQEQIKRAYRNLARKHHPDVNKSAGAEEKFKEINEAYQILSNAEKRAAYDRFGHQAFEPGGGGFSGWQRGPGGYSYRTWSSGSDPGINFEFDFGNFADPFDIFEMMFGGRSPFGERTRQPRYILPLTFAEAVHGCEKEIEVLGRKIKIRIPAGVDDGTELRFEDIRVVCEVARNPLFRRQGFDILVDEVISFTRAALGGVVKVPTIDGELKIKIPAGTQPGTQIRLRGKGVPHLRGGGRGDQYVRIRVIVPEKLSYKERNLLEELASLRKEQE